MKSVDGKQTVFPKKVEITREIVLKNILKKRISKKV